MTKLQVLLALCIGSSVLSGCGDDDGGDADASTRPDAGLSIEVFTGTWVASEYRYTNNADATEQYDIIADGGVFRMAVLSGGRARTFLTVGTVEDQWDGLLTISGTTLTSTPQESTRPTRVYEFTLTGDELTLVDANDDFDFTQTGADEVPATVDVAMTRE